MPDENKPEIDNEASKTLSPRDQEIIDKARKAKTTAARNIKSSKSGIIEKKARKKSLEGTVKRVQDELPPTKKIASKFIHSRPIEMVSDFLAATIARPNALLAGSVTSFVLTLGIYSVSKIIGYEISGFETIATFILGWIIGILYDYFHLLVSGR